MKQSYYFKKLLFLIVGIFISGLIIFALNHYREEIRAKFFESNKAQERAEILIQNYQKAQNELSQYQKSVQLLSLNDIDFAQNTILDKFEKYGLDIISIQPMPASASNISGMEFEISFYGDWDQITQCLLDIKNYSGILLNYKSIRIENTDNDLLKTTLQYKLYTKN